MNTNMKIGMLIHHLRNKHKITQSELGKRIGVGPTTISNYENNYSSPNFETLLKISNEFGVNYKYFLNDCDDFDEKLFQNGVITNRIPYFCKTNYNGILTCDNKLADSFITLPIDGTIEPKKLLCTSVNDNSMRNIGLTSSSYVIIDCDSQLSSGNNALIMNNETNEFFVRKYITDGKVIMLISDGYTEDTIYTSSCENKYTLIGKVVKAIINI